jgi:transcriptional regulator with XRE-family HTH domain
LLSDVLRRELARYAVGEKIRALRWQRGLRLVEVSKKTGLSSALLSKIERGQSVPTIPALFKIATCLDVGLTHFFPHPHNSTAAITRSAERIRLPEQPDSKESAYEFECLNFKASSPLVQCYRAEFCSSRGGRFHAHPGGEFIFVMSGGLKLTIVLDEYLLESGDSMYFDSAALHSYARAGETASTALVVTFPAAVSISESGTRTAGDSLRLRGNDIVLRRVG